MIKFITRFVLPVVLVVVAIFMAVAMVKMRPEAERKAQTKPRPVVTAFTIETGAQTVTVRGFGSVKAKRSVDLVPQVSGEIIEKSATFEAGAYCAAGDILLRIDDTDYALAAARAEADVAQAALNLALAEEEALVAREEWERHGSSSTAGEREATDLVLRKPQLELAEATLASAQAALRQAQVNLGRCVICAPFDGRVLAANGDVGQYLRSGNMIGTVYATDIAEVTVQVADNDLAWIDVTQGGGDDAHTAVTISAEFAGHRHTWDGRAVRLGGAVDSRSRLVPVVVEIQNGYRRDGDRPPLVDGLFVEVLFNGTPAAASVVIPRTALRPENKVWVIDDESRINIRRVDVSRAGVDQAVISAGLAPGERVCTSNLQFVTEGLPVRVEGDPVPAQQVDAQPDAPVRDGDS